MSKRSVSLYIVDILIAIDKIQRYTKAFNSAKDLLHSEIEWDAVLRELQIIGNATDKVLKYDLLDKSFRRIVDFRNQIVHAYFGIDKEIVWGVITEKLDFFKNDIFNSVKKNNIDLTEAIQSAIKEHNFNKKVIEFLKSLLEDNS